MIIVNGNVFGEDGQFHKSNIWVAGERIQAIYRGKWPTEAETVAGGWQGDGGSIFEEPEEIIDASGLYIIPGLVDIHFHGSKGYDVCDGTKEALEGIAKYQAEQGVTSICPATMTLSKEELANIFEVAGQYCREQNTIIKGITMEGPFISQAKKGAQNAAHIHRPDVDFYREMQTLSGNLIKQVAVAPEEDTDLAFIREVSKETVVSIAHTQADYELAGQAFEAGATHVTHLLNAMSPFLSREPGVVGAALDNPEVFVELICDGVHIHPSMVRAMFQLFGPKRICMVSDSMRAAGMPDGTYTLGGQEVTVTGKEATLEDGTIAGSISTLYDCLKTAVLDMGILLEQAVLSCTQTPAKSLGLDKECGSIAVGRVADLVLLDEDLNIKMVIKAGKILQNEG